MADSTGDVRIVLTVDSAGAVKSVQNFDKAIEGLGQTNPKAGSSFGNLWKQMAAGDIVARGVAQGLSFLKSQVGSVIEAALEGEKADRALGATLEITGRRVPGMADSLSDYASELQSMTIYDDEAIKGTETLLAQMTDLDEKGLKQATRGAIGLASVFGMDLQSAGALVTKALSGSTAALSRYGIHIDDTLPKQQKQVELMKRLEEMFQRATAATNTGSGSIAQMKNTIEDAKEKIGNIFLPVISEGAKKIADLTAKIVGLKKEMNEGGAEAKQAAAINEVYADAFYLVTAKARLTQEEVVRMAKAYGCNYKAIMDEISAGKGSVAVQQEWQKEAPKTEARINSLTKLWGKLESGTSGAADSLDDLKKSLSIQDTGDIRQKISDIQTALSSLSLSDAQKDKLKANMNKLADELVGPLEGALRKMARGESGKAAVSVPINVEFVGAVPSRFLDEVTETLTNTELPTKVESTLMQALAISMAQVKGVRADDRIKDIKGQLALLGPETLQNTELVKKLKEELEKLENMKFAKTIEGINKVVSAISVISSSLSGVTSAITNAEEIRVENWYKKRLSYISKTISSETKKEKAIAALEAEYEIKKTSAKRKAAIADKAVAMMNAVINTAQGVTAAMAMFPPNPVLAALVKVMGAIQLGIIAATPIPLAKGGLFDRATVLPSGYRVAEAGSREIVSPEPLMRQIVRQESRITNENVNLHVHFNISALDGASVEQMLKTTGIPLIQQALDRRVLKVATA